MERIKSFFTKLLLLIGVVPFAVSCDTPRNKPFEGANKVFLTLSDERVALEVSDTWIQEIDFLVRITAPLEEDALFEVVLENDGREDFAHAAPITFTIPKGKISGRFSLKPDIRKYVSKAREVAVRLKTTNKELILPEAPFVIKITPTVSIELTEREQALVKAYEEKWGVDIIPFLGDMQCNGRIEWAGFKEGDYDYPRLVEERTILIEKQVMQVRLSEQATEDRIILDFVTNALGQTAFMRQVWEHLTIYDYAHWNYKEDPAYAPPAAKEVRNKIKWHEDTAHEETFEVQLSNVILNPETGDIQYIWPLKTAIKYPNYPYMEYMDGGDLKRMVVPFHYETSVWTRILDEIKKDDEFALQVIWADMNIYNILNNADITRDVLTKEDIERPNYFQPTGKVDFKNHTLTFSYPWYVYNSDRYSGTYVTCTPVKEK